MYVVQRTHNKILRDVFGFKKDDVIIHSGHYMTKNSRDGHRRIVRTEKIRQSYRTVTKKQSNATGNTKGMEGQR